MSVAKRGGVRGSAGATASRRRFLRTLVAAGVGAAALRPPAAAREREAEMTASAGATAPPASASRAAPDDRAVRFPARFLWGAATSAHQVEGGNDWNDWARFERRQGAIHGGGVCGRAVGHFERFDADFALAAADGHNAHRLSFEWSRIEPERGRIAADAVRHYHDVLASLRRRGLTPVVTLHHFTNPVWIADRGGWEARETLDRFDDFVRFCAREYGGEVDWWCTVNEPEVYAFRGWSEGVWPPGVRDNSRALAVIANQLEAHARATAILKQEDRTDADGDGHATRVGFAKHVALLEPLRPWFPLDALLAHFENRVFNEAVIAAPATGVVDLAIPGARGVKRRVDGLAGSLDWIGLNYYTRWKVKALAADPHVARAGAALNDLGWELHPAGIATAIRMVGRAGRPVLITENGTADAADRHRPRLIVETLAHVARAMAAGTRVIGYLHWSLLDNFEWADGWKGRFGLYRVDAADPELRRERTGSADVFARIARAGGIPRALAAEVDAALGPAVEVEGAGALG